MGSSKEDLEKDLAELRRFLDQSERIAVKNLLSAEIRRTEGNLSKKREEESSKSGSKSGSVPKPKGAYNVQVKNYSWDQSDKFVKIYLTGIENAKEDDVIKEISEKAVEVRIENCNGKNHVFTIKETCSGLTPDKSYVKVKSNMVVIFLAKAQVGEQWDALTMAETRAKKAKEPKIPKETDKNADPQVKNTGLSSYLRTLF